MDTEKPKNISDHLANERTFLAWIRTSVGVMALGFVVVKFSLFVKQLSVILGKEDEMHEKGYSAIMGILLVAVGTFTTITAFMRYKKTEKQITANNYKNSSLLISVITGIIFLMSALMIAYLVSNV
jgi:putative membrane protein